MHFMKCYSPVALVVGSHGFYENLSREEHSGVWKCQIHVVILLMISRTAASLTLNTSTFDEKSSCSARQC
jgi:hypothetical protein